MTSNGNTYVSDVAQVDTFWLVMAAAALMLAIASFAELILRQEAKKAREMYDLWVNARKAFNEMEAKQRKEITNQSEEIEELKKDLQKARKQVNAEKAINEEQVVVIRRNLTMNIDDVQKARKQLEAGKSGYEERELELRKELMRVKEERDWYVAKYDEEWDKIDDLEELVHRQEATVNELTGLVNDKVAEIARLEDVLRSWNVVTAP